MPTQPQQSSVEAGRSNSKGIGGSWAEVIADAHAVQVGGELVQTPLFCPLVSIKGHRFVPLSSASSLPLPHQTLLLAPLSSLYHRPHSLALAPQMPTMTIAAAAPSNTVVPFAKITETFKDYTGKLHSL